MDSTN